MLLWAKEGIVISPALRKFAQIFHAACQLRSVHSHWTIANTAIMGTTGQAFYISPTKVIRVVEVCPSSPLFASDFSLHSFQLWSMSSVRLFLALLLLLFPSKIVFKYPDESIMNECRNCCCGLLPFTVGWVLLLGGWHALRLVWSWSEVLLSSCVALWKEEYTRPITTMATIKRIVET